MKENVGKNIARYRKIRHLTQEELAKQLNISYQAVSKWETGRSMPDMYTFPKLAAVLHTSIDQLMGYSHNFEPETFYEKRYSAADYYWGVAPNELCLKILKLKPPASRITVLDIGCGEGQNAVFLARCGYQVSAFDLSDSGLDKTRRLAEKAGVMIDTFKADIRDFRLEKSYDILFANNVFTYIPPDIRSEVMENYRRYTAPEGLNAFRVFVRKPFIAPAPDAENDYLWKSGELFTYYHDWWLEECSEVIYDCCSSGIPHQHAADTMIARKVTGLPL